MHLIVYISDSLVPEEEINTVLAEITDVAKQRNLALGITGLLFYHQGKFLQILEGKKANLEELMGSINRDVRHKNVDVLVDEPIEIRSFSDWNMDSLNLSALHEIEPELLRAVKVAYSSSFLLDSLSLLDAFKVMLVE